MKVTSKKKDEKKLQNLNKKKLNAIMRKEENCIKEAIDKEMVEVIENIQKKKFEHQVKTMEDIKRTKGKAAATFHLRDTILGKKKTPMDQIHSCKRSKY